MQMCTIDFSHLSAHTYTQKHTPTTRWTIKCCIYIVQYSWQLPNCIRSTDDGAAAFKTMATALSFYYTRRLQHGLCSALLLCLVVRPNAVMHCIYYIILRVRNHASAYKYSTKCYANIKRMQCLSYHIHMWTCVQNDRMTLKNQCQALQL